MGWLLIRVNIYCYLILPSKLNVTKSCRVFQHVCCWIQFARHEPVKLSLVVQRDWVMENWLQFEDLWSWSAWCVSRIFQFDTWLKLFARRVRLFCSRFSKSYTYILHQIDASGAAVPDECQNISGWHKISKVIITKSWRFLDQKSPSLLANWSHFVSSWKILTLIRHCSSRGFKLQ